MKFTFPEKLIAVLTVVVIVILIVSAINFGLSPKSTTYVSSEAMIQQTPTAILTPWLCWITETMISCQATSDVLLRRGQNETRFQRGSIISWKNPVGTGKAQIWFGCTGSNSCDGQPIFSSQSVKVESNCSGCIVVAGKEDVIPFGSIGIAEINVDNNKFISITNRWAGASATPILKAGPGITISCINDACVISKL